MKYVVFYFQHGNKNDMFSVVIEACSRSESLKNFNIYAKKTGAIAKASVTEGELFEASAELVNP